MMWQYKTVQIQPHWGQADTQAMLDEMGETGWELVHYGYLCVFKRPHRQVDA